MKAQLDKIDRRILGALQKHCKMSVQELAETADLSSATCWRRLRNLEQAGLIDGYRAILNRRRVGYEICAFVHLSIERQQGKIVSEIEDRLNSHPAVMECYATTGDSDFTLRVVATDIEDYDRFLQRFLFQLPGIGQVRSSIALREIKQTTELPL